LKRSYVIILCLCVVTFSGVWAWQSAKHHEISLSSSKVLSEPAPGTIGNTNSFPATIALSPDHHYAAFLNDGYGTQAAGVRQSISVLDLKKNAIADFPDDRFAEHAHQSFFLGLAFSSDGKHVYASVGSITDPSGEKHGNLGNGIAVYRFTHGKVSPERFIKIPPQKLAPGKKVSYALRQTLEGTALPYPAGLTLIAGGGNERLLIANNLSDNIVLLDVATGQILKSFDLSTHNLVPSEFPYTCIAKQEGTRAWCSLWNGSRVAELDLTNGKIARSIALLEPKDPITPGSHPTALALTADENLLYVALANADCIAVVSTSTGKPVGFLDTQLPGQRYSGTYPNALALSANGNRLFAADASLNAVAVFDTSNIAHAENPEEHRQQALGFIPTEWYPSALATQGDDLIIATAKGQGSGPNNGRALVEDVRWHRDHPYIPTLISGSVARLNFRQAEKNLADFTRQVEEDNLLHADPGKITFTQGANPIHHVIYVLKENRTFDQVLGDLKVGNGDGSLTMYGADITPNQHKLALQFGVLDNFYDSGEVSGDGHLWSTAAITSDYNEKTWQIAYRGRERIYDFQGTVSDEYMMDYDEPDVDDPATGFLWDNLARHGRSYRNYGEFVNARWCRPPAWSPAPQEGTQSTQSAFCPRQEVRKGEPLPPNVGQPHGSPSPWPWPVPMMGGTKPTKAVLRDHFDPLFPDFNTDYPDQLRADEFLNEFDAFVRARKQGKATELPAFVLLYLPDDHTGGTRPGKPTPKASVADNDLAVGRVVDAVSHSPYWDDTAIFIVEDDAQNGADHVDAHRSIALVVSKYSPEATGHPFLDHRFYTTVNLIHTMEELLGLPPMNQNDAYAPLMASLFSGSGNQRPFAADYRNRDNGLIYQTNPKKAAGAAESSNLDFTRPDAADAESLNAILWRDAKGNVPMPLPRHTVFPATTPDDR
jgi:DNA-binding beta-propeller fold protein YncE